MLRKLLALMILLAAASSVRADDDGFLASGIPGDTLSVSLVTFQPGTEYGQRFGHNALLLRESTTGVAVAYNYGLFDFRQKNFFLNFARGWMVYRVAPNYLANDLQIYAEDGRWALEQKLDLSPQQRGWLRDYLAWNVQREHADYRYDYFVSNCSTRVRDALDRALGGALRKQLEGRASGYDYRNEALRLISPDRPLMIAMDVALGPSADRPIDVWQQSFGPLSLMQALRGVRIKGDDGVEHPLVAAEIRLLQGGALPDPPSLPPDLRLPFLLVGLALAGLLFAFSRQRQRRVARLAFAGVASLFTLLCGLGGIALALLWGVTDHWAGWRNENLLVLNPLCLLLLPVWLTSARTRWQPGAWALRLARLIGIGAALALVIRLVPALYQANLHWVLLLLPVHAVLALCLRNERRS